MFNTWREAKVSTPLSAESAFTLSSINKRTSLEELYKSWKKEVLYRIKDKARDNNTECYYQFPSHAIKGHKEQLKKDLEELGYIIPHFSNTSIIINWETE